MLSERTSAMTFQITTYYTIIIFTIMAITVIYYSHYDSYDLKLDRSVFSPHRGHDAENDAAIYQSGIYIASLLIQMSTDDN